MQKIMFDNNEAQAQLTELLRKPQAALLLVGSGSSRFVGYPSWSDLISRLRNRLIPDIPFPQELKSLSSGKLLAASEFIINKIEKHSSHAKKLNEYHYELETIFRPKSGKSNYEQFHQTLVRLPFCGVVTTNYDTVLESAIGSIRKEDEIDPRCHSIDLCIDRDPRIDRSYRVFEFLRGLSAHHSDSSVHHFHSVLHLHGYWEHPERIILTKGDYERHYGFLKASSPEKPNKILDTLHRKVVWSLLVMRPVVFVGFSLKDPAFELMLSIVKEDFNMPDNQPLHFALLPSMDGNNQQQ